METLFAHLAARFPGRSENLATEALAFMLAAKSPTARAAFRGVLERAGVSVADDLHWVSQVGGEDDARPDLVGHDASGAQAVIVEAKFWAGLTDKQPVAYLKRLPPGGVLCVIGPAKRHSLLVGELMRKILAEKELTYEAVATSAECTVANVNANKLVVLSWRAVVAAIIAAAEQFGEKQLAEDGRQLLGLCDAQDTQAFLPVSSDELTAHGYYRRVIQFSELVDDLTEQLGPEARKGLRPVAGKGYYGRYLWLRGVGVLLLCDIRKWTKYDSTPLWLSVRGPTFEQPGPAKKALESLASRQPCQMFEAGDGFPAVPLRVPTGVEKDAVLRALLKQIQEIGALISHLAPAASSAKVSSDIQLTPEIDLEAPEPG